MADKLKLSSGEVIILYLNGNSCRQISLKFGISRTPILKILKDNNIILRTKSQALKLLPPPSQISKEKNRLAHLGKKRKENLITPLMSRIRHSDKYFNWRTQIFGRDNYTCQKCGERGSWLEAHHIKRFTDIIKENNIETFESAINCNELWDLDNGITLCKSCHELTKWKKFNE